MACSYIRIKAKGNNTFSIYHLYHPESNTQGFGCKIARTSYLLIHMMLCAKRGHVVLLL